ncbi:MAG: adenylate/guanylate cyclase domain-containing protein [Desulfonauticus sp.]|nr:adenylate/guanylate cyclase domain-containing protein [Desulfonauticus sp.]
MLRKHKNFLFLSFIFLLISLGIYAYQPRFFSLLELKTFDLQLHLRPILKPSQKVIIVAIDEKSLEKIGRWPWSRKVMAKLVRKIDLASPYKVGYDISFFDPEKNVVQRELISILKTIKNAGKLDKDLLAIFKTKILENYPDLELAQALASSKSKHILGYYFNFKTKDNKPKPLNRAFRYTGLRYFTHDDIRLKVPVASKVRHNIPLILKGAGREAYFNVIPDKDGTFRRYPLVIKYGAHYFQPLALAMYRKETESSFLFVGKAGIMGVKVGKDFIPTDQRGFLYLNYRGPAQSIPHVSAWKLLQNKHLEALRDKYVIVGVTAPGVYDLRVTPFGVAYPGVEIQATALDNLLQHDFLVRPGFAPLFDLVSIFILWLITVAILLLFNPVVSFLSLLGVFLSYGGLTYYLLAIKHYVFNLVYPLLTLVLTYLGLISYRILFADRQKRELRQAFSKYLDAKVVEQITKDPSKLKLGGEKRELTVLFADIRGFTSLSEKLSPEQLVSLLNEYLTEMTEIILNEKGLLDKYIGDAIMAIFGTPIYYKEHAFLACSASVKMLDRLKELNNKWQEMHGLELNIGIGINTGEMVAGNMGSQNRFDYTVMGDNVNLASRLEGLNKYYGTNILISEFTFRQVQDKFPLRNIDLVRVKGKKEPVKIYELLSADRAGQFRLYKNKYEEMLLLYYEGKFGEAMDVVDALLAKFAGDPVLSVYKKRLSNLIEHSPLSWDGVYTFTTK